MLAPRRTEHIRPAALSSPTLVRYALHLTALLPLRELPTAATRFRPCRRTLPARPWFPPQRRVRLSRGKRVGEPPSRVGRDATRFCPVATAKSAKNGELDSHHRGAESTESDRSSS